MSFSIGDSATLSEVWEHSEENNKDIEVLVDIGVDTAVNGRTMRTQPTHLDELATFANTDEPIPVTVEENTTEFVFISFNES